VTAPGLVIFDCDGVLIDSEVLAVRADVACLAEEGIAQTEEEILERYVGISMTMMKADLERRFGRKLRDDFDDRHRERLHALFETELRPVIGVAEVLDRLQGKVCVASSSGPERLRHALGVAGLYRRFEPHVFSATMVAHGKPAPDLFLHAASRMAVEPPFCAVIEDSVPGVQAAVAAGMTAIGFTGGSHCRGGHGERLLATGAAAVVATMADLLPALGALPQLRCAAGTGTLPAPSSAAG
jgi:HAD superfamily hydrolase (TIGR01509 family)